MTEQQKNMVQENHNLIYSFLNQYNFSIEEFYDLAAIGLCRAAMNYDEDKSQFSTYAYQCMLSQCMTEINKRKKQKRIPEELITSLNYSVKNDNGDDLSFESTIASDINVEEDALFLIMVDEFKKKLNPKNLCVFEKLLEGKSMRDIAAELGCSHQCVFVQKKQIENQYIKYFHPERVKQDD